MDHLSSDMVSTIELHHSTLPKRGGLGLKPEYFESIINNQPDVGFFEVHAENYFVAGGPFHYYLSRIREQYALSIHGVGLNLGGETDLNQTHLQHLRELLNRYQAQSFSEHLAWSSHGSQYFNDLLPIAYNKRTLDRVCDHIDETQSFLKTTLLLENPSTYVAFKDSDYSEAQFITEVVRRTGCGLLLDVNNAYISSQNHGFDAQDYLSDLPLDAIGEIHLAGFYRDMDTKGSPLLIDTHNTRIDSNVWMLYQLLLNRIGKQATLIEWDSNLPEFNVLLEELKLAESILSNIEELT